MSDSTTPVILSAVRTPIGRYLGGLSSFTAPQLGSMVIREAVRRAGVDANEIDEVIMGQVVQGGSGQAPARQALIHAGLPASIPALTINKVCGSGLKAVMLAAQAVKAGDAECLVAGGQEAMSSAPHYVYGMRGGIKAGNQTMVDGMIHDGLWDSFGCCHMGEYAEYTAEKAGVSREDQDRWALRSQQRFSAAQAAGSFEAEIVAIEVPGRKGPVVFNKDEHNRPETTAESLAKLKPAFRKEGTITAGNAPGLNSAGAAMVVAERNWAEKNALVPMARLVSYGIGAVEPGFFGLGPVPAVREALVRAGWSVADVDRVEINEAFAAIALACLGEIGFAEDVVNVEGGAIAHGHPIGASGAILATRLMHSMKRDGCRRGIVTLCIGGGQGIALALESLR